MTVERVEVPGIRWSGGVIVPLSDGEGGWWTTTLDGTSFWRSAADVRRYVDEMAPGDLADIEAEEPDWTEAHRALADLVAELEAR